MFECPVYDAIRNEFLINIDADQSSNHVEKNDTLYELISMSHCEIYCQDLERKTKIV